MNVGSPLKPQAQRIGDKTNSKLYILEGIYMIGKITETTQKRVSDKTLAGIPA